MTSMDSSEKSTRNSASRRSKSSKSSTKAHWGSASGSQNGQSQETGGSSRQNRSGTEVPVEVSHSGEDFAHIGAQFYD
ncbi:hypothetical protein MCOR25_010143 [Pyricularia grisea]|uniref:Uncharacterized protein n=1 Tax=Pyricularia grisea TaxID=148305 RepID=A0A6P8BG70_PYRGI|nr:uncharacterized protein PgNI_00119 [Pyricularia grisea]KAI6351106.1 hypothetical protein MCOR25_010143 [Pyricularia grisea]TLD15652.1 hypothetical protein PgNI_00119 [Pyricularia grisea]